MSSVPTVHLQFAISARGIILFVSLLVSDPTYKGDCLQLKTVSNELVLDSWSLGRLPPSAPY